MSERPYTLIAELTHRCPLRCLYCSNPVALAPRASELETHHWVRVLEEAEALGVLQVTLTGGEPLLRDDLEELVAAARKLDLYTTLITSGVPLDRPRLERLKHAGLDAIQLSIQDVDPAAARRICGGDFTDKKSAVLRWIAELELPLTLNAVIHRENIGRIPDLIALAEESGATRLELANAQYLGWALENRSLLLPDRSALERAREIAAAARTRLEGRMEILFVLPDYHAGRPRACMGGWAQRFILVAPDGRALPCHAAAELPGLPRVSVRDHRLEEIWHESEIFRAYRGDDWMQEPCRSCPEKSRDHGGCRCQAFQLTGDATQADPACARSPHHGLVTGAVHAGAPSTPRARRLAVV